MSDYISREAAIKVIQDIINHSHEYYVSNARAETAEWCLKKLKELPAADVEPVRHGRWLSKDPAPGWSWYATCSVCGDRQTLERRYTNYCPNCGALMDQDGDGE